MVDAEAPAAAEPRADPNTAMNAGGGASPTATAQKSGSASSSGPPKMLIIGCVVVFAILVAWVSDILIMVGPLIRFFFRYFGARFTHVF